MKNAFTLPLTSGFSDLPNKLAGTKLKSLLLTVQVCKMINEQNLSSLFIKGKQACACLLGYSEYCTYSLSFSL